MNDYLKYLDPDYIGSLNNYEMRAKFIVDGFLLGMHKSPFRGFSSEFSQHKQYNHGDEIKDIDWKVYGRTDKYFIKEFEEDTNLQCNILLDCSKSMGYKNKGKCSKFEYSKTIAAALCYILIKQKDAAGLTFFSDRIEEIYPAKTTKLHLNNMLKSLEKIEPSGNNNTGNILQKIAALNKKRGLVIILSDFLEDFEEISMAVKHLRFNNNEVILFHILDDMEIKFDIDEPEAFFTDIETGNSLYTNTRIMRKNYLSALEKHISLIRKECYKNKCDYFLINTSLGFETVLRAFFRKRNALK